MRPGAGAAKELSSDEARAIVDTQPRAWAGQQRLVSGGEVKRVLRRAGGSNRQSADGEVDDAQVDGRLAVRALRLAAAAVAHHSCRTAQLHSYKGARACAVGREGV